ncbi:MAG: hypothetical protein AUJ88_00450 [Gallionellaceae bacterium CG1_02_56_997]|nr:MAG: hypothetical protein AUJ88_00450 [Gallionellaceae bacterium CG1_02_56_997]
MARLLTSNSPRLLSRLIGFIITAALIVVGLMFSAVLLVFIVIAGVIAFGYLWWKTRAMRKQMRKQMREQQNARGGAANDVFGDDDFKGEIIEGEVIHKVVCLEEEVKR